MNSDTVNIIEHEELERQEDCLQPEAIINNMTKKYTFTTELEKNSVELCRSEETAHVKNQTTDDSKSVLLFNKDVAGCSTWTFTETSVEHQCTRSKVADEAKLINTMELDRSVKNISFKVFNKPIKAPNFLSSFSKMFDTFYYKKLSQEDEVLVGNVDDDDDDDEQ